MASSIRKLLERSSTFLQRTLAKPVWQFSRYVSEIGRAHV